MIIGIVIGIFIGAILGILTMCLVQVNDKQ